MKILGDKTELARGIKRRGLRYSDRTAIVRALREGASWRDATATVNVDPVSVEAWRETLLAEAGVTDESPAVARPTADAGRIEELEKQLAAVVAERDSAKQRLEAEQLKVIDLEKRLAEKDAEVNSLLLGDSPKPSAKPTAKVKR